MAVSPVSLTRVTQNIRTDFTAMTLQQNQLDLFNAMARISTGRSYVTPGEDPAAAARALKLNQSLSLQGQFGKNLEYADGVLASTDSSIAEINSLLIEASSIASMNVSNLTSADERDAEAELIAGILGQLVAVGNRQFNGRYIFGGRRTDERPFTDALGGVAYLGDTGDLLTRIEDGLTAEVNVPGNLLYGALSSQIAGNVNLSPTLSETTRFDSLNGAGGHGIRLGQLVISEEGGAGLFRFDLTKADTIGDVAELITAAAVAAGSSLTASVAGSGLFITPGGSQVTITDTSLGAVAADLGILTREPTSAEITGDDLGVRLTSLTLVENLSGGAGIDLDGGLIITNGPESVTVDLSGALTVQDVINKINNAGAYVLARISADGAGIDLFNQVSGTSLTIGENGGTTAADLGVRTLDVSTPLDRLNMGKGVTRMEGKTDLAITAGDGQSFEVNLDDAVTVGDVIDFINAAAVEAGVSVTASFAVVGNGIRIVDGTGGDGDLIVGGANLSQAALDLGIDKRASSEDGLEPSLSGGDVNPTRTEGFLDAMVQLEEALRHDDTQGITLAAERLDALAEEVRRVHGIVGARSQSMQSKLQQIQDASYTTQTLLSQVEDLDFTEAVTRMQAAQYQLQAGMQTSAQLMNLSLMDFLR